MNNDIPAFDQFMKDRELAAQAFVNGATGPLRDIATETSPATFFGPDGDYVDGADRVFSRYERDAGLFESGTTDFEILQARRVVIWRSGLVFNAQRFASVRPRKK